MMNEKWFDYERCGEITLSSKHTKKYGYEVVGEIQCNILFDKEENEYIVTCKELGEWGQDISEKLAIDNLVETCLGFLKSMGETDIKFLGPQTRLLLDKYNSLFKKVEDVMERGS